ncbi:phage tail protein [Paraburkholderia humisilvae]|uniref:Phage tail protein n=1 Tax=Paraburkholderia humisilvae TaxID=627669 RepID=A0A6J5ECB0_9BURK|nr:phage tail protein [Paraburkholderia humisilvae]CAB3764109.1 hypothetical protein LMG29542_04781 [Paraburkholderia humisilvae]
MALEEYVGAIVMEVDSQEIEVISVSPDVDTGTKPVPTMNRKGRIKGFARGIRKFTLKVTVVIPLAGDPVDWENLEGAKITIFPVTPGGQRVTYQDCGTQTVSDQYTADNEARRDLTMFAADKVTE